MGAGGSLDRAGNLLGALSLAIADRTGDALEGTAAQSPSGAAALSALLHFLDRPSVDLLRQVLGLTSSGTVRLVDRLERDGLVTRAPGDDGRVTTVVLTPAGRRAARRVAGARADVLDAALAGLDPGERAAFDELAGQAPRRDDPRTRRDRLDVPHVRHRGVRARARQMPGRQCHRGGRRIATIPALVAPTRGRTVAVDVSEVAKLDVEPGTLPETMAAWVIRQEREGEPKDAFQIEEIEVPEPGAFEVIVRVMAAGVNFNNVWAALGKPVSVFGYGDHPEYGHHIGGSDASGIVWKVGEGVTRWQPGDEVVIHCNQASYEDVEVHGLDPMAAPSQEIWGYETTWGSFAQFTKVQAQQLLPKPRNLSWVESSAYGLTYFTAYRMLLDRCKLQAGHNVLIWGAAGGLGVFATQLCKAAGANAVGVVSSDEKGELVKQLGAVDYVNRAEFGDMMRTDANHPAVDRAAEKERFAATRGFAKKVKGILGDAPDIVFEHVGQATFPTSVFTVKPFGKVVICGATSGYTLDFDVRYLWMKQKEILGSHFANAYECTRANQLMAEGKVRPVLSQVMDFDGVPEAHQMLHENRHSGKIAIRVGATDDTEGKHEDGEGAIWAEVGA